jgi:RNA polymerase sigma factor (sigma-70 family)
MEPGRPPTDADLVVALGCASAERERAFAELVARYGPTVLAACRRVLADAHDAEDAFQAVFLVLARKAGTIRPPGAVGGWLYGVAVRTARKAKTAAARRRRREMIATARTEPNRAAGEEPAASAAERAELRAVIDAELAALPEMQRAAVVLCDLHGRTRAEAAAELERPEGTVVSWLARGRKTLGARLTRRGVALPGAAGLAAVVTPTTVSAELAAKAAAGLLGHGVSASALTLAEDVMRSLSRGTAKLGAILVVAAGILVAVTTAPAWHGDEPDPKPVAKVTPNSIPPAAKAAPVWRERRALELTGWLGGSVAFTSDGATLFVGGDNGHVRAYEAATLKHLWDYTGDAHFAAVAVSPDDKTVAITAKDGVRFLDSATGKETRAASVVKGPAPTAVAFFPTPPRIAGAEPGAGGRESRTIFGNAREYFYDDLKQSNTVVATNAAGPPAGQKLSDEFAVPLAVAPDGTRVVARGPFNSDAGRYVLWAWSPGSSAQPKSLVGHQADVVSAAWSKDGKSIATGDADGTVFAWDAATFKEKSRLNLGGRVAGLAISADGKFTAAAVARRHEQKDGPREQKGAGEYTEEVYVFPTANPPKKLESISSHPAGGPFRGLASVAFAPDGKTLVSAFANLDLLANLGALVGKVRVFALEEDKPKAAPVERPADNPKPPAPAVGRQWTDATILTDHNALVNGVAVAPDGKSLAAAVEGGVVCWDVTTRKQRWAYKSDGGSFALAYSPDGKHLAAADEGDVVRLDAATGKVLAKDDEGQLVVPTVRALAYSPDGKYLAANNGLATWLRPVGGGKTRVLGQGLAALKPPPPAGAAWSKDGKRLAVIHGETEGGKYPVTLWNVSEKEPSATLLTGHEHPVTCVAWSKDGKAMASGDAKGHVILWSAETGKERWRSRQFRGRDDTDGRVNALAVSPADNTVAAAVSLGSGKGPERVILLAGKDGKDVEHIMRWNLPVSCVAWSADGALLVTGCGEAGGPIGRLDSPTGEVVIWERRKP